MLYDADGRALNLDAPTAEQLAAFKEANAAARKAFEQRLAAEEAAKVAAREAESEKEFKASCRPKYASLHDADFERLWLSQIRDKELLERAEAAHQQRLAEYSEYKL